jgi:hypothetical protein
MQHDRLPYLTDRGLSGTVLPQEFTCSIRAVHLKPVRRTPVLHIQTDVVKHRADVKQLRVESQLLAIPGQRAEQKSRRAFEHFVLRKHVQQLRVRVSREAFGFHCRNSGRNVEHSRGLRESYYVVLKYLTVDGLDPKSHLWLLSMKMICEFAGVRTSSFGFAMALYILKVW